MALVVTLLTTWHEGNARYESFLECMRKCGDVETTVIHGSLSLAPPEGFILYLDRLVAEALDDLDASARLQVSARLVPFVLPGSWIIQRTIEPLKVACGIDDFETHPNDSPEQSGARGLFGRKDLAPVIGATCQEFPVPSEHYAYLTSDTHNGLPHLLVDYLRALQKLEGE